MEDNTQSVAGKDFWPDNFTESAELKPKMGAIQQLVVFLLCFAMLQIGWQMLRDEAFGHFVRGPLTVQPATALINHLTPTVNAQANGNQIKAAGGGIVVKIGCEGVEAMFILFAAFAVAALPFGYKFMGMLTGTLLIYLINQARIVSLFYAYRTDKSLFYLLHGTVTPMILVLVSCLFFYSWLARFKSTAA